MRKRPGATRGARVAAAIGLLALLVPFVWSRGAGLDQSLWHDEVWTVVNYVSRGPRGIFADYIPNNHMLFSLLAWATAALIGPSEVVYRLWAALPACAAVVTLVVWLWRHDGPIAALILALFALTSPLHLDYAREARGYGLAFLADAALLIAAARLAAEAPTRHDGVRGAAPGGAVAVFAAAGLVGICTLPIFVLPFLATATILLALCGRALRRKLAVATALVLAAVLAFYAPVLRSVAASSAQRFGEPISRTGIVVRPVTDLLQREIEMYVPGVRARAAVVLAYALATLGVLRLASRSRWGVALVCAAPIFLTYAALAVLGFYVADRFVSFLLLNALVLLAAGTAALLDRSAADSRLLAASAIALLALGAHNALPRFAFFATRAVALPREDWKGVAALIDRLPGVPVVSNSGRRQGLDYYLRGRVVIPSAAELDRLLCRDEAPLVFIDHPLHSVPFAVECLERSAAQRVAVAQREVYNERSGRVEVWFRGVAPPILDEGRRLGAARQPPGAD